MRSDGLIAGFGADVGEGVGQALEGLDASVEVGVEGRGVGGDAVDNLADGFAWLFLVEEHLGVEHIAIAAAHQIGLRCSDIHQAAGGLVYEVVAGIAHGTNLLGVADEIEPAMALIVFVGEDVEIVFGGIDRGTTAGEIFRVGYDHVVALVEVFVAEIYVVESADVGSGDFRDALVDGAECRSRQRTNG